MTKNHKLGDIKPWKCIASQFWGLEAPNLGVSRAMTPLKPVREDPSLPLPPSGGFPAKAGILGLQLYRSTLCLHCHMAFSLVCLCPSVSFPLFIRTPVTLD